MGPYKKFNGSNYLQMRSYIIAIELGPVWPDKNRQMSIKVAQKIISLEKWCILTPFQKLPKNVGDLVKLMVAKGFKKLPKIQ